MDSTSIKICNLLRDVKKQSELYIGHTQYNWDYMVISYSADCTEALPLSLMDKTICGLLNIDGALTTAQLGSILGLNVTSDPANGEYRDTAEATILDRGIRSLLDFGMISRDYSDGVIFLTDIGKEYYNQGKKYRTIEAHTFDVYFDRTTATHGKAKKIFEGVRGRSLPAVTPEIFKDEKYLKTFIHEQLPSIYNPEKGNSFTNVSCPSLTKVITVPIQIGVLYDVVTKEFRYVAFLEDKICPELSEIISSNAKLREELNLQVRVLLRGPRCVGDMQIQDNFELAISGSEDPSSTETGMGSIIPDVMEEEEFWQGLNFLVNKNETDVFIKVGALDEDKSKSIISLCEAHPTTNVFVSYGSNEVVLPQKKNLFQMAGSVDGDYVLCTSEATYSLRGYALKQPDDVIYANMIFRYADPIVDPTMQKGPFAVELIPKMITDTLAFLEINFDITKRSIKAISECDRRINVFEDFLSEETLSLVRKKKQEAFNRVKLEFEKTLIEKLTSVTSAHDLEEINKIKELEEISLKVDEITGEGDETYVTLMELARAYKQMLKDRERTIKDELIAKIYIIDTNVFLEDPDILSKIKRPNRVILSGQVLQELDKKKNKSDDPVIAANARKSVNAITAVREKDKKAKKKFLDFVYADMSLLPEELQTKKGDNFILGVAMKFKESNPWMLTSDKVLGLTAESIGIPSVTLEDFYTKNGLTAPQSSEHEKASARPSTYVDVFNEIYELKGYVLLTKFEKACKKYGIKPESLGYESFVKLIESDPQFSLSTNAKGVTYINKRR